MELWCFLHSFQKSPYRYLYLASVLLALQTRETGEPALSHFVEALRKHVSDMTWVENLLQSYCALRDQESQFYQPSHHRFVFYGDAEYPRAFLNCSNPPLALSCEGPLLHFENPSLSVVGSREPHEYTRRWMQTEFYQFMKAWKVPVISGGARGVDQMAHRIALLVGAPTAVVLPSGLARKYPALWSESHWADQKITFISEMRLNAPISKQNFSSRNRLIAYLGSLTLIAEAREKSGTLITAHHALIEGKPVCVVPGHPSLPQFAGSLQLLVEGASFLRNALDLSFYFKSELQYDTDVIPQLGTKNGADPIPSG